jgi:hypothetical protein
MIAVAASAAWFGWLRAEPIELSILLILGAAFFGTLGMFSLVDEDNGDTGFSFASISGWDGLPSPL